MGDLDIEKKPMAEEQSQTNGLSNGLSNGTSDHKEHKDHHKSKDRDKSRDRHDKDRHKSSHKDKDRDKERSKDKDRHSSSSHKSSHKDKDKDRDKDKSRDKDRHRDKEHRDKERSDKDKDRSRDDKHKDRTDKDKKDKEKDKSDRHKDKDKDKSRDKDRDRHRDDKDRKSSSSSKKDKDRHHSSHKSSHKDKHRDRDKHHSVKKEIKEEKAELENSFKMEVNDSAHVKEESRDVVKEEPMDTLDMSSQSMDDFQVSRDSHAMKEDSEDDSKLVIKEEAPEEEEDDDLPLATRKRPKFELAEDEEEEDKPLISRKKAKTQKKRKIAEEEDDFSPAKKKAKKKPQQKKKVKAEPEPSPSPTKGRKKKEKEEEQHVWKWWEEEKRDDGRKWTFLEHKGPVFADPYEPIPPNVKFYYDGQHMILSQDAEEVAGFYSKMLEHDYTTKEMFNKNFFKDWRKVMTEKEKAKITELKKCDFRRYHEYYTMKNEERKNRTKEEKKALKEKNEAIIAEYGWCTIDGHKQRIGNFKIEPPGLFRGRGEHPKQGSLKKRTMPEEVIINCSKDSSIPKPPEGRKWKEVRSDPNVTWLACWNENIQGSTKYVMLNAASKLKGEKDWQKYESARRLHIHVDKIRDSYRADWKSKEMRIRQRGVALYFIDKLALRAGNEKDEDQADTVGCCSLRFEHLKLYENKDGKEFVVVFDFLGKDSIRYYNEVPVEKRVFKNLQLFMENKQEGDDIFDRLNTQILNKYLNELLDGLTAKVFRTYNASRTLQEQLEKMTNPGDPIPAQILSYNRANREVAILCNHQRAVPKTFDKSMANLTKKIEDKREVVQEAERELKSLKRAAKHGGSAKDSMNYEKKKKAVERLKEQLEKLEISATDKEENKQIALGTSKLNYLDPRITVAWCKKNGIPVDKVYNKTQRQKFQWAIDMATGDYNFLQHDKNEKFKGKEDDDFDEEEEEE